MVKRLTDIIAASVALALLAGPMLLIALAIRLESRGPALFRQRRAGRRGKAFTILKYRTMRSDAAPYGPSPHSQHDHRLTRLGRLLRETSLDELPQLLNVLAGQMSLVGPRPLYERQAARWDDRQRHRLDVRPGITGYAQAYGRGELPIEDKIEMDLEYINKMGIWFDLRIIGRTLWNGVSGRGGVYEKTYSRHSAYEHDAGASGESPGISTPRNAEGPSSDRQA
ncbi:MAG: sugar transferase [Phycisphaerae bacterium]|nr:sugar transferase [Phycisphaerae bacterium]